MGKGAFPIETTEFGSAMISDGFELSVDCFAVHLEDLGRATQGNSVGKEHSRLLVDEALLLTTPGAEGRGTYGETAKAALVALDALSVFGSKIKPKASET